jgi:winged helix DNA-binding protein
MSAAQRPRTLTLRELNRATLARQLLLRRAKLDVVAAVERLAALQAQWSPSPYFALWSRLTGFKREDLWSALESHAIVRARLMRGTLHLVSARDFYAYAVATQDLQRGAWNRIQVTRGADPARMAALAVAYARTPRQKEDVIAHLRTRMGDVFNERFAWLLWRYVSAHADLVSAPPGGHWEYGGTEAPYVAAKHWIGGDGRPSEAAALERLARRCIAAFGPVSLADIVKFAGQVAPRIRPALDALAPKLRLFKDEAGRNLYDLPTGPRPRPETRAPVRFLPRYDEMVIAYQLRDRIVSPRFRSALYAKNGIIEAAVLVDGMVAATWAIARTKDEAVLEIHPLTRIVASDRAETTAEGERLVRFAAPEARSYGVRYR